MILSILGFVMLALGLTFFLMGSYGLLRLKDNFSRLHALSKIDNLALGFTLLGTGLLHQSWLLGLQLLVIWLLCLLASATSAYLLASRLAEEQSP